MDVCSLFCLFLFVFVCSSLLFYGMNFLSRHNIFVELPYLYKLQVKLVSGLPVERQHAAWIGGSILGICGSFQQLWLTRSEYEEIGAHRAALKLLH